MIVFLPSGCPDQDTLSVGVELYEKKEGIEPKPYPLPLSHGLRCHPFRSVPVIQEQVMVDEQ